MVWPFLSELPLSGRGEKRAARNVVSDTHADNGDVDESIHRACRPAWSRRLTHFHLPSRISHACSPAVTFVSAGPEHAAAVTDDSATQLWGSNEFYQLAQSQETPSCVRPVPVVSLSARKVLSLACGGSHSLAIIGDGVNSGAGALFAWGTGTVGQLGLGNTTQILDGPAQVNTPPGPDGKPSLVTSIFAGLVSSAAISAAGDCYVWGDASAGRLGLPGIPDMTPPDAVPQFVNAAVVWTPTILRVQPGDVGMTAAQGTPRVVSVALGGSFSLFSVWTGSGPGNVLLVSGALGWDITRDTYGYPPKDERELNGMIDDEVKAVPRRPTPLPTAPFGTQPTIMAAFAGARHAAVVVSDPMRGGAPRLYTAGKGWLGHGSGPDSVLLERPTVSPGFVAVGGALAEEDVAEAGCGHSHTLARTSDGRLFAWGRGDSGELGHGNLSDRALPVPCRPVDGHYYTSVAAGSYYSVAVADAGFQSKPSPQQVVDGFKSKWSTIAAAQEEASKPPPAPAPAPVAVAASPAAAAAKPAAAAAAGGAKADPAAAKKKKEAEAQEKARAALEEGELPPDWSWEQTDDGEVYYIKPDGDT